MVKTLFGMGFCVDGEPYSTWEDDEKHELKTDVLDAIKYKYNATERDTWDNTPIANPDDEEEMAVEESSFERKSGQRNALPKRPNERRSGQRSAHGTAPKHQAWRQYHHHHHQQQQHQHQQHHQQQQQQRRWR